jgi:hypothetical protein
MTPLTIVVLLCIATALLFVCVYLCIAIRDLKEFIRNQLKNVLAAADDALHYCRKNLELSASINKDNRNLIKAMNEYLERFK